MSGGVDYFTHCDSRGAHDLWLGEAEHREEGYLTDLISRRAVETIERFAAPGRRAVLPQRPLHRAALAVGDARRRALAEEVRDNLFHLHGGNIHTYRRMIGHMDEGIGRIVAALEARGVAPRHARSSSPATTAASASPTAGRWSAARWTSPKAASACPGSRTGRRASPPADSAQPCMTMDWSATMLAAAGAAADPAYPLDGVSLLPVLADPAHRFALPLYWRMNHRGQRALRDGDWKYLRVDGHDYLFDLSADERERANLGKRDPDRLASMRAAWEAWNATMPPIPADATVSLGYGAADMPQR
jgi:arylsulfatase A-like enzyme